MEKSSRLKCLTIAVPVITGLLDRGMLYAAGLLEDDEIPENPAPVDVINMSLGGGGTSEYFTEVVERVHSAGVIMVGSAGNSGGPSIGYPACLPRGDLSWSS